jgi:predicted O-methyltransferase YrrM
MHLSLNINYLQNESPLCEIGRKYDTDKSSIRENVSDIRHCHPYTLFYNSIFQDYKNNSIDIAELGILDGASLLMWSEYFTNATIYGFEYNADLINNFKERHNTQNIILSHIDVTNKESIKSSLKTIGTQYDIIIEDTTHQFEDQIRVIENSYEYLKPGGVLIIEDIFKRYQEEDYIRALQPILHNFQDYYFVSLDHKNRNSNGWDNDKLFVLVKGGAEPIFKSKQKITIITPSCRIENLKKVKDSIDFSRVDEWIIVYDGSKIEEYPYIFENSEEESKGERNKIKEYVYNDPSSISGNAQRNYALDLIINKDTYIYFLDDDNIIHPDLYKFIDIIERNKIYTFNQSGGIKGNNITVGEIDSAMFLIHYSLCKDERWILPEYAADGYYISGCFNNNKEKWVYVDNDLCYYNKI